MSQSAQDGLQARLTALHADLRDAPGDVECTPEVGRLFNALLPLVKQRLPEDPILWTVGPLKLDDGQRPYLAAVQVLTGQLLAALADQSAPGARPTTAAQPVAPAGAPASAA